MIILSQRSHNTLHFLKNTYEVLTKLSPAERLIEADIVFQNISSETVAPFFALFMWVQEVVMLFTGINILIIFALIVIILPTQIIISMRI